MKDVSGVVKRFWLWRGESAAPSQAAGSPPTMALLPATYRSHRMMGLRDGLHDGIYLQRCSVRSRPCEVAAWLLDYVMLCAVRTSAMTSRPQPLCCCCNRTPQTSRSLRGLAPRLCSRRSQYRILRARPWPRGRPHQSSSERINQSSSELGLGRRGDVDVAPLHLQTT